MGITESEQVMVGSGTSVLLNVATEHMDGGILKPEVGKTGSAGVHTELATIERACVVDILTYR